MNIKSRLERNKSIWIVGLLTILISDFVSAIEELVPVKIPVKGPSSQIYHYVSQYGIYLLVLVVFIILSLIMLKIIKEKMKYKLIWAGGIIGFILGLIGYYAILMFYARCWQECEVRWVGNILDFLTPVGSFVIFVLITTMIGWIIGYLIIRRKK